MTCFIFKMMNNGQDAWMLKEVVYFHTSSELSWGFHVASYCLVLATSIAKCQAKVSDVVYFVISTELATFNDGQEQ